MSNAKSLIEERAAKLHKNLKESLEYKYLCLDTGMYFETEDADAVYSPYTGGMNIEFVDTEVDDDEFEDEVDDESDYSSPYDYSSSYDI